MGEVTLTLTADQFRVLLVLVGHALRDLQMSEEPAQRQRLAEAVNRMFEGVEGFSPFS